MEDVWLGLMLMMGSLILLFMGSRIMKYLQKNGESMNKNMYYASFYNHGSRLIKLIEKYTDTDCLKLESLLKDYSDNNYNFEELNKIYKPIKKEIKRLIKSVENEELIEDKKYQLNNRTIRYKYE